MFDLLTLFAWVVLALLFFIAVAAVVWIGSLPKAIALQREHPQVDAINALSWLGLLFGGVGWAIALVWAFYRPAPVGQHGEVVSTAAGEGTLKKKIDALESRIAELESRLPEVPSAEK